MEEYSRLIEAVEKQRKFAKENPTKVFPFVPWYYAGPYVPSGVIYGASDWPSRSHWLIPGTIED